MKRKGPSTESELAALVERTLADVPLAAEEVKEVARETGIDLTRFADRVRKRIEAAKDEAARARFEAADRDRVAAVMGIQRKFRAARPLSSEKARARLRELQAMGATGVEFHKLDQLSPDDLNQLVEEFEVLLGKAES